MKTKMLELTYDLYFAPLDILNDITEMKGIKPIELQSYLLSETETHQVYLLSILGKVLVTDDIAFILRFVDMISNRYRTVPENWNNETLNLDVFFQEFSSFEEAYKVALTMKEQNELCYKNN